MQKHEIPEKPLTDDEVVKLTSRVLEIENTLQKDKVAGAKKLKQKDRTKLEEEYKAKNQKLGIEFLARYNALVKFMGIEIRAIMETNPYQPNVAQAVTRMQPYRPKEPKTKPWHEAMADNLHSRAKCEHVLHAEGTVCEKCGLPQVVTDGNGKAIPAWGSGGKGVTKEYSEHQKQRIEEEKKKAQKEFAFKVED